jgi:hypothetical protein
MQTTNKLASDVARCIHNACELRERCLRWLLRNDAHATSFVIGDPDDNQCELQIKTK